MDWLSFTIGLGGLGVAAITVILSYKARKAPFREKLYEAQVHASLELIEGFMALQDTVITQYILIKVNPEKEWKEEKAIAFWELKDDIMAYFNAIGKWKAIAPAEVVLEAIGSLESILNLFVGQKEPTPKEALMPHLESFAKTARKCLHVEPLSEETLKLLGLYSFRALMWQKDGPKNSHSD